MKRAIQFGAGNIGRGFIGAVLSEAGYHVVFADVNMEVIDRINKDGAYTVHIMDVESRDVRISNISGVDSGGGEIVDEIVRAEIITTAVGLRILPFIAPAIAKGIAARRAAGVGEPLNVIACENGIRATSQLREEVYKHLSAEEAAWCDAHVGFADCSVDRIVPPVRSENPIDVVVENFYEWNVEEKSFVGGAPHIEGMNLADNLLAYIERKLFTLNTGHAITAYLGRMKGLATIDESIADPAIFAIVKEAMQQSGQALVEKFGFDHLPGHPPVVLLRGVLQGRRHRRLRGRPLGTLLGQGPSAVHGPGAHRLVHQPPAPLGSAHPGVLLQGLRQAHLHRRDHRRHRQSL